MLHVNSIFSSLIRVLSCYFACGPLGQNGFFYFNVNEKSECLILLLTQYHEGEVIIK